MCLSKAYKCGYWLFALIGKLDKRVNDEKNNTNTIYRVYDWLAHVIASFKSKEWSFSVF